MKFKIQKNYVQIIFENFKAPTTLGTQQGPVNPGTGLVELAQWRAFRARARVLETQMLRGLVFRIPTIGSC